LPRCCAWADGLSDVSDQPEYTCQLDAVLSAELKCETLVEPHREIQRAEIWRIYPESESFLTLANPVDLENPTRDAICHTQPRKQFWSTFVVGFIKGSKWGLGFWDEGSQTALGLMPAE